MKTLAILLGAIACTVPDLEAATLMFAANLNGAAERPVPVTTSGTGQATLTINDQTGAWSLSGNFSGLNATVSAAHVHGPADVNGTAGVIQGLTTTGGTSGTLSGSGTFSAQQVDQLKNQLFYVNVHTQAHTAGEIRGQLVPAPIPEPAVLACGLLGVLLIFRRRHP